MKISRRGFVGLVGAAIFARPAWAADKVVAGTLYALLNNFADPLTLHYSLSGYFVVMTVIGGMRTFWGPLVGAAVFVLLQDYVSSMTVNWMFFIGAVFMLVVLFFPRGLLGMRRRAAKPGS